MAKSERDRPSRAKLLLAEVAYDSSFGKLISLLV